MVSKRSNLSQLAAQQGPLSFGLDRRVHARLGFDCPVRCHIGGAERTGWARDASDSGAGFVIRSSERPTVGDTVELVFKLDNYYDWLIDRRAVVQWCEPLGEHLCQVGVKLAGPAKTRH